MAKLSSDHLPAAFRYSQRYSRGLERERIAEAKGNWSKNFTVKDNKNTYVIAVAIALTIASVLLAYTYFITPRTNEGYMTMYLLDSNRKAADYPELLVANVNSTFSVFVGVENHMGNAVNYSVLVGVTNGTNPVIPLETKPVQTINGTLINKDGAKEESVASISLNQPGNYFVAFELYIQNQNTGLQFTGQYNALNIQVIADQNATTSTPTPSQ